MKVASSDSGTDSRKRTDFLEGESSNGFVRPVDGVSGEKQLLILFSGVFGVSTLGDSFVIVDKYVHCAKSQFLVRSDCGSEPL